MFADTLIYENNGKIDMSKAIEYADSTISSYLKLTNIKLSLAIIYIMDDNGEYEYTVREMKKAIESHGVQVDCFAYDTDTKTSIIVNKIVECNKSYTGIYIVNLRKSIYDIRYFRNLIEKDKCIDGLHDGTIADILFFNYDNYHDYFLPVDVFLAKKIIENMDSDKKLNLSRISKVLLIDDFKEVNISMKILGLELSRSAIPYMYYQYSNTNTSLTDYLKEADIIVAGESVARHLKFDMIHNSDYIISRDRVIIDLGAVREGCITHGNLDLYSMKEGNIILSENGWTPVRFVESRDMYNIRLFSDCLINNLIKAYHKQNEDDRGIL